LLIATVVYDLNWRFIGSLDSMGSRLLPIAFLTTGHTHLDQFDAVLPSGPLERYWVARSRAGHLVPVYPVVVPTLALPLFVPAALVLESGRLTPSEFMLFAELTERVAASLIAAASAAVMFRVAARNTAC
jgi:hypothetical protein